MNYLSCEEVARKIGITVRRIQQMCKQGEITGAVKDGRSWRIPENAVFPGSAEKKKPLPVGVSDFKSAATDYYYLDKTLLIRDFLDTRPMVSLFTRPGRFGKTLNIDMLRVFFEKTQENTSCYFKDKKIWKCGDAYTRHQGQYPVIFLTFKDVKCFTWEETFQKICKLISLEFIRHVELEESSRLSVYEKEQYHRIAGRNADELDYQMGLQLLSLLLHKHYGKACVIIIDEYDIPIQQGENYGFYSDAVHFIRNFFSGGLKDNPHLNFGFLTGVLQVAKESIFSDMNNLKISSVLDENGSEYFGFTSDEVKSILTYYGKGDKFREICEWYGGYRFGNTEIFNPWSVISYISDRCFPRAFWQATGSNGMIGEIISAATPEVMEVLQQLLRGEKVTTYVDTSVIDPEIQKNPYSVYSFLLITGYLKAAVIYPQDDGNFMCDVAIPNREIAVVYEKEILNRTGQSSAAVSVREAIFSRNAEKIQPLLEDFMLHNISLADGADEAFCDGMMLRLCALLGSCYRVHSDRKSGSEGFDIQLIPLASGAPGFLFELKHTEDAHVDLKVLAEGALQQIDEKKYDVELRSAGVKSVIRIGIAFRGKDAAIRRKPCAVQ